jgi:hypothetical protein
LVAQKGEEELPEEAAQQLRQVLASYDEASRHPPTGEHPPYRAEEARAKDKGKRSKGLLQS